MPKLLDIGFDLETATDFLNGIEDADVVEVRHGKWIFEHDPLTDPKKYFMRIVCSCCGLKTGQVSNFYPHVRRKDGRREGAGMKGFIEIIDKNSKRRFLNVRHIEEVCEIGEHHCDIYMAFNCPNAVDKDYFQVRKSYDEIVALIERAML